VGVSLIVFNTCNISAQSPSKPGNNANKFKEGEEITGVSQWLTGMKVRGIRALDRKYSRLENPFQSNQNAI